jgi:hypothetical protein
VSRWLTQKGREQLARQPIADRTVDVVVAVPKWDRARDPQTPPDTAKGLVLRTATLGTLYVCRLTCPIPSDAGTVVDPVTTSLDLVLPQFGQLFVLPLHNGFMQNSVLDVSLSEDGVITKLGVHNTSTVATGITALGGSVDTAKGIADAKAKAADSAATAAKTKAKDDNKTLADCLDAQNTIVKHGGTPIGACQ